MVLDLTGCLHCTWPAPGSVVSVPYLVFFKHRGIVSDRWHGGKPTVISNSGRRGRVVDEPWDQFADGHVPTVERYPGLLRGEDVVARARSRIGSAYRLLDWNCDHLVSYAHGLAPQSVQLAGAAALIGVATLVVAASRG